MNRLNVLMMVIGIAASGADVQAGLVKLATYEFFETGGGAPETDPRIELVLQLPSAFPPNSFGGLGDDLDIFWHDGNSGIREFTRANDPTFLSFQSAAQNGTVDLFTLWTRFPSGGGRGHTGTEFDLFHQLPDLRDFSLETVRLVVTRVDIEAYTPDPVHLPDLRGYRYEIEGRYEFLGHTVPEPSSLLLFCCVATLIGYLRRGKERPVGRHSRLAVSLSSVMLILFQTVPSALAQCVVGGFVTINDFEGGDTNEHPFPNQCAAIPGTDVVIVVQAMADLGCSNLWDRFNNPTGGCPTPCASDCCDVDPTLKYVTATANGVPLNASIPGSQDMPLDGRFFAEYRNNCLSPTDVACRKAGRSPCDSDGPGPFATNLHQVKVPAAVWNTWLGHVGGTIIVRLTASAAVSTAPLARNSLALYCENLGFDGCGSTCVGLCAPTTHTVVQIVFQKADCLTAGDCNDGNTCTTDTCSGGFCQHANSEDPCNDAVFCNGADTCASGTCSAHAGDPCVVQGLACDESADACICADATLNGATVVPASDPLNPLIDARQPHPVGDSDLDDRQGIGSGNTYSGGPEKIVVTLGVSGAANPACWSLCETGIEAVEDPTAPLSANFIKSVVENPSGTYEITLTRPISAGHWTAIIYESDESRVIYGSLPGNVDGSTESTAGDITKLIDFLNGVWTPPFGNYSTDINRSTNTNASDITRLIDLLNGAGVFISWAGEKLPENWCLAGEAMDQAMGGGESLEGSGSIANDSNLATREALIAYFASAPFAGDAAFDATVVDRFVEYVLVTFSPSEIDELVELLSDPATIVGCPAADAARLAAIATLRGQ